MRVEDPPATGRRPAQRDEHWRLADERDFLRRSLEDAAREHEAGDLSDEDHALLVARDSARLAEVEAELSVLVLADPADAADGVDPAVSSSAPDGAPDPDSPRTRMPLWRLIGIVVACGFIVLGAVVLVAHFVQARQPGQASSGSVSVSQAQQIETQLQQALVLNNKGNVEGALVLYNKVLGEDPSNPAALAYAGYLEWNQGSRAHVASLERIGRAQIQTAVKNAPTYYQAHLFYGLVLTNQDHNDQAAVAQFNDFVADGPPAAELAQVEPLVLGAYEAAGVPVPSAFTGGGTPTSSP
jgi:tetratricopeptide (TPR) repeat protein